MRVHVRRSPGSGRTQVTIRTRTPSSLTLFNGRVCDGHREEGRREERQFRHMKEGRTGKQQAMERESATDALRPDT